MQHILLIGNPNVGKSTLIGALGGQNAKTANISGVTAGSSEHKVSFQGQDLCVVDLPGCYALDLDRPESKSVRDGLDQYPSATVVYVADATAPARSLAMLAEVLSTGRSVLVLFNRCDVVEARGGRVNEPKLQRTLGLPVLATSLVKGVPENFTESLAQAKAAPAPELTDAAARLTWATSHVASTIQVGTSSKRADWLDWCTGHRILGPAIFLGLMTALFWCVFSVAGIPMGWIESFFAMAKDAVSPLAGEGLFGEFVVDGVIGSLEGTVIFVPQISMLFGLISLLEQSGYLARAAFALDRSLRRFGLSGWSFLPALTAHACAIPAIMGTRLIAEPRDRLATVLALPFFSCAARLPVYALLTSLLFPENPTAQAIAFVACYVLGGLVGLGTVALLRFFHLRRPPAPFMMELPPWCRPSIKAAVGESARRSGVFLKKAGTVILAIGIGLWVLTAFPRVEDSAPSIERSFAGQTGRFLEPAIEPLGWDWRIGVGVVTSFAAREVFATTTAVLFAEDEEADEATLRARVSAATTPDGERLFTIPTTAGLLTFYVLALQCLPTVAVVRRELESWRWALGLLAWSTAVAWAGALLTRAIASLLL